MQKHDCYCTGVKSVLSLSVPVPMVIASFGGSVPAMVMDRLFVSF